MNPNLGTCVDGLISRTAEYYGVVKYLAPKLTTEEEAALTKILDGLSQSTQIIANEKVTMTNLLYSVDVLRSSGSYRKEFTFLNTFNLNMCYDPPGGFDPQRPSSNDSTHWVEMPDNIIANIVIPTRELRYTSTGVMTLGESGNGKPIQQSDTNSDKKFEMYIDDTAGSTGEILYLVSDTAAQGSPPSRDSPTQEIVVAPKGNIYKRNTFVWTSFPA